MTRIELVTLSLPRIRSADWATSAIFSWLRGADLNHRPSGYEPDELPTAPPRDVKLVDGVGFEPTKRNAADLQSAPFNHSGTYPYLFFKNLPLTGFEPVASPLPRECATPAPQRQMPQGLFYLNKNADYRNRTYNLRFTKPLLYHWAKSASHMNYCIKKIFKCQYSLSYLMYNIFEILKGILYD